MRRGKLAGRALALVALAGLFAAAPSCASFAPLADSVCGNSVLDDGEDCDSHAPEKGTRCAAPQTPNACRFLCGEANDATCPTGWGCGRDDICRERDGSFAKLGDLVLFASPHDLRVADFDGDGTTDVLLLGEEDTSGLSPARIVFGANGETPRRVEALPVNIASPVAADLDAEGASELAFADLKGVSVFQARTQDRAVFAPFPTVTPRPQTSLRVIPMEIFPADLGDEIVTFIRRKEQPSTTLERPNGTPTPTLLTSLPGDEEDLIGPIVWGRIDEAAACLQIVFPFKGLEDVSWFTPCRTKDGKLEWNDGGSLLHVQLPPGVTVDRGVLLVDLDLDQHLDLLIAAGGHTYVAWGLGDGTFTSAKVGGTLGAAGPYALPGAAGGDTAFPLAAADLNGDGLIDFVVASAIVVSTPDGYQVAQSNSGSWTQAAIADFNADGRLDVAAGSSSAIDIELFLNAGGDFNPSKVDTDGPTSHFVVGDFDGDLVTDLAFAQELDQPTGAEDDLSIAFGAAYGKLSAPVITAALGEIEQLAPAHLAGKTNTDAIADLLTVSQYVTDTTDALFEFQGAGSRSLQAPLPLEIPGTPYLPIALASGWFGNKLPDLVVLGADPTSRDLRFWRIDETAGLVREHLRPSGTLPDGFLSNGPDHKVSFAYGASLATGDLDHDPGHLAEVVLAAPFDPDGASSALLIAHYEAKDFTFSFGEPQPFPAVLTIDSTIRLIDVDGDGHLDGVLTTGSDESPGDVLVFWGDGKGHLDTTTFGRIHNPEDPEGFIDIACLPLPSGKGCDLFAVNGNGAVEIRVQPDRTFRIAPRHDLSAGRAIGVGSFDGDGLPDLAIQTHSGLQLFRSVPRRE